MKTNYNIKVFKNKRILFPRVELSGEIADKILRLKLGFGKGDVNIGFNF